MISFDAVRLLKSCSVRVNWSLSLFKLSDLWFVQCPNMDISIQAVRICRQDHVVNATRLRRHSVDS